jgi:hypothetical protein
MLLVLSGVESTAFFLQCTRFVRAFRFEDVPGGEENLPKDQSRAITIFSGHELGA